MAKEMNQKIQCFDALGYFDRMAGKQVASRLAVLKQYEPLDSIYSEDKGPLTFVHFVVSGECMILQCLRMKVTAKKGKEKTFELVKIKKGEDMQSFFKDLKGEDLMAIARKNVENTLRKSKTSEFLLTNQSKIKDKDSKYTLDAQEMQDIEKNCGFQRKPVEKTEESNKSSIQNVEAEKRKSKIKFTAKKRGTKEHDDDFIDMYGGQRESGEEGDRESFSYDDIESSSSKLSDNLSTYKVPSEASIKDKFYENDVEELDEEFEHEHEEEHEYEEELSEKYEQTQNPRLHTKSVELEDSTSNIENRFIDVGSLTFGGIFGLGELLEHRVIMARTTVQCILIPRFYLFEKKNNPGEIWNRRRFYIESSIPSRQQLFENFLTTRKWQKFKNDLIERNLGDALKYNPTKVEDIPIMCRIVEPNDE